MTFFLYNVPIFHPRNVFSMGLN